MSATQARIDAGSPGSHPHADQPNWQPATTAEEYLNNCGEGLEVWSERRFSSLSGLSRKMLWRARCFTAIPSDLFDRLLKHHHTRSMIAIGRLFLGDLPPREVERCPHCDGILRVRAGISPEHLQILERWQQERRDAKGNAS